MEERELPSDLFARFAAGDLVRWRALAGRTVTPTNERWGEGRVTDVRWEGRSEFPDGPGIVYVRVQYSDGLRVRVNSQAFARLHRHVSVDSSLADLVERWFGDGAEASADGVSRAAAVAECDRVLRAAQDEERKRRASELRSRVRERRAEETGR